MNLGSIPGTETIFSAVRPDWLWGPPTLLLTGCQRLLQPVVEWPVCVADHSRLSSAEISGECCY